MSSEICDLPLQVVADFGWSTTGRESDLPSGSLPPSPPPSPPTHHDCQRCGIGVSVKDLCLGQFMYESQDSEWHEVCCYR